MPPKKRKVGGARRPVAGKGIFGDIWNGIKSVAGPLNSIAKSTGIIGKVLPGQYGALARAAGYGKKRKSPKKKASGVTRAGMIVQKPGAGFKTAPMSLNGGVAGGGKGFRM